MASEKLDEKLDEKAIFNIARKIDSPDARAEYLHQVCGADENLFERVNTLLCAYEDQASFLESPAADGGPPTVDQPITEKPGMQIGPYKLLQEIGEGGMGVVYMAEQSEPVKRRVALKIIKPGMDTRQVIARFEAEKQALAMMDHPNIAKVFDAGTTDSGRPYFVMELVNGILVTKYCDEQHLTARERLELFIPICQAVQHAHQKGIIHRDIKPTNILVALYDGRPVPKVIDFGVAKATGSSLTDKTMFTGLGQIVGTIEYMSPEQANRNQLDIDTRSDVYSLGVVLYELLTGETPFDKKRMRSAAIDELLRIIREEEPPKPSTKLSSSDTLPSVAANRHTAPAKLSALVRGELDWIVMKALEKDRARRYETANGFANDIKRYLNDEAVQACPPSARYRFGKFARRNKGRLVTASLLAAALLVAVGGVGWAVRDREAQRAEVAREKIERQTRVTTQVELLLSDVDRLMQEQQWDEALATVWRAEVALAGGEVAATVEEKVQMALKELEFVARLNEIRMEMSVIIDNSFDYAGAKRSYGKAFRDFGVDVESLPVATAVAQLKQHSRMIIPAAMALDDFVHARRKTAADDDAGWRSLVEMASELDPDPVRDQLRATWGNEVTPELQASLRALAESFDVRKHSPNTAVRLAITLERSQLVDLREQTLRQAQQTFPGDYWVNLHLGNLLLERKQFADAVRFHSAALASKPTSTAALNKLGNALWGQEKLEEAINCYRTAIELDPNDAVTHGNLGLALREQGHLDEAITEFRKAIELDPKLAGAYNILGNALKKQGHLDEAITEYCKAIELDPKSAAAHNNLGLALEAQGKLDQAIAEYRLAIELDPKSAHALGNLGLALREQGQLDEAIAEYRLAIELNPKYAHAHGSLGVALADQGKLDEAINCYRTAIELDPKFANVQYNLGNALKKQGKLDEAIKCYRKAIELDPKLAMAYDNLGFALREQGHLDEAITEYRKAIELDPNRALPHNSLGVVLKGQGHLNEAIAEYRLAIELNPKYAGAHTNLGNTLREQRKFDEAITEFRTAIELDPNLAVPHNGLGLVLKEQGHLNEAIDEYRLAIEIDPKSANAHTNLGIALAQMGLEEEAITEYRTAIELDPNRALPHNGLGLVLKEQGHLNEAIDEYRLAIEIDPKSANAHTNLGNALAQMDLEKEAITEYRTAIELDPNDMWLYGNLVWLLATAADPALRNPSEAVTLARKATDLQPKDANHWCNRGVAEYRAGNWQDSVDAFRQADVLIGGVGDRQHRFFLAMAHWQLGNQAQAHEAYEQAVNWLSENNINDKEQFRFRDEAESLLKKPQNAEDENKSEK